MTTTIPTPAVLRAVLALTGDDTLPQPIADALAIRDRLQIHRPGVPPIADLLDNVLIAGLDELDGALEAAAAEYSRRVFIQATRQHNLLTSRLDALLTNAWANTAGDIVTRLKPVFDKAAADLARVAGKLPAGASALDPAAVLDADARAAYMAAADALDRILALPPAFGSPSALFDQPGGVNGVRLAVVVATPAVPVELIHPFSEQRLTTGAELARIRDVRRLVEDWQADQRLTLLDVVRGHYGDAVTLELAMPDELPARLERIKVAHTSRRVREHEAA